MTGSHTQASVADFTMLKVIGKGSFGKVCVLVLVCSRQVLLARHNSSQRLYAIKVLSKELIIRQVCF